jgi:hypothetical protein
MNVYTFSSTKLKIRAKEYLLGSKGGVKEGVGKREGAGGRGE